MTRCEAGMIIWVQLLGTRTPKILEKKAFQIWRDFGQLHFDREYLRDGLRRGVNGVVKRNSYLRSKKKNRVNFGPLTTQFARLIFTHPKSAMRAISDNSTLRSRMSLERINRSTSGKRRYQLRSFPRSTKKINKLW